MNRKLKIMGKVGPAMTNQIMNLLVRPEESYWDYLPEELIIETYKLKHKAEFRAVLNDLDHSKCFYCKIDKDGDDGNDCDDCGRWFCEECGDEYEFASHVQEFCVNCYYKLCHGNKPWTLANRRSYENVRERHTELKPLLKNTI